MHAVGFERFERMCRDRGWCGRGARVLQTWRGSGAGVAQAWRGSGAGVVRAAHKVKGAPDGHPETGGHKVEEAGGRAKHLRVSEVREAAGLRALGADLGTVG